MTDFRVLVLDIDGTTLTKDRRLTTRDLRAAEALREQGVQITLATGRLFSGTRPLAHRLGVALPVACMNGSERVVWETGERQTRRGLPAALLREVQRIMLERELAACVFCSDHVHVCERAMPLLRYLESWSETFAWSDDARRASVWQQDDGSVLAVAAAGDGALIDEVVRELEPALTDDIELWRFAHPAGGHLLKLRDRRENKGTALRELAAQAGVTEAACVAVGDWFNDVPMLVEAGRSFAMAQAPEGVRASATDVLEASSEAGGAIAEVAARVWGVEVD